MRNSSVRLKILRKNSGSPLTKFTDLTVKYLFFLLFVASLIFGCTKKTAPAPATLDTLETSLYGISYYRGVDFPAEYVFISILNPKNNKIKRINFLNEPQSLISDLPGYGPQDEQNLTTWGIGASKYMDKDSAYIKEELLRNITSNTMVVTYRDSTTQTIPIMSIPHFKYIEKYRSDTTKVSFWANPDFPK